MNESVIIQKMIAIGQSLEREEIFYSGAEADARALLKEIKQALTIPVVVGQSEQLKCSGCNKPLHDGLCGGCCSDLASGNY